ncbi:DUF2177 family protein [Chenggangzhangella methanolivorans]|uniref:DUF2177 family protein n=1 Tax=Chenggangzhangella methanolivorans TaxID=1437009 RepID=A0A9E6UMI6_9HYPH|nr:DUF2177 family protein [Chenggangzhangella methanolivorans]QZO01727.1 DUF2177 family protein [Chenggangzhangella methanolivorans]
MKTNLIAYGFTAVAFLVIDGIWLGLVARGFYRSQMGDLMSPSPSIAAAAAFYLIFVFGLVWFAVSPALASGSWTTALVNGAVLGLVGYATYDLTNLAVVRGFPPMLAMVDLAWGTVLSAVAATVGFVATPAVSG